MLHKADASVVVATARDLAGCAKKSIPPKGQPVREGKSEGEGELNGMDRRIVAKGSAMVWDVASAEGAKDLPSFCVFLDRLSVSLCNPHAP